MTDNDKKILELILIRQNIIIEQLSELSKAFAKVNNLAIEESNNEMELITEDELD